MGLSLKIENPFGGTLRYGRITGYAVDRQAGTMRIAVGAFTDRAAALGGKGHLPIEIPVDPVAMQDLVGGQQIGVGLLYSVAQMVTRQHALAVAKLNPQQLAETSPVVRQLAAVAQAKAVLEAGQTAFKLPA